MSWDGALEADLPSTLSRELFDTLCGDLIGAGMSRRVYASALDKDMVIKIEMRARSFQNIMEWELWNEVSEHGPIAKWLAPCSSISACGLILIQSKTTVTNLYPAKLPNFLTDTKKENYGLYRGKLVCHDYGTAKLAAANPLQLRSVEWWSEASS